jgi:flagellar basal body-associated protein FliL
MKKRFIIILLIVLTLVGIGTYLSWKSMSFSKEALKVEILGSEKTTIGEEVEYVVKMKNNGDIRLESPELTFTYPEGSIIGTDESKVKVMNSEALGGDIYPGEERSFKFTARLLGKEKDTKVAKVSVSFQPKDLKTRSEVSTTFTTILGTIPLDLNLDVPAEASSGKAFTFRVNYSSNVTYPLTDLTCYVELPSDFEFLYSQPNGMDNTQWDIPVLNDGGAGKIEISGILNGQAMEQKVFKARIGIWQNGNFILLKEVVKGVQIVAPALYITQKVNNDANYMASPGDQLHYEITFRNVGDNALQNLALITKLNGDQFDLNSIKTIDGGKYQAGDNSIVWDASSIPELNILDVGQVGTVEFWVNVKSQWAMKSLNDKNPIIKDKVTLGGASQEFLTKINSVISAQQKIYSDNTYFENSGPYPLESGQKTTLTVEWKAINSYNDLESAKMITVLPESVTFVGKTYPEGTEITYDEDTSEVVCNIGSLPAGSGIIKDAKICAFQISVQPELAEEVIILLGSAQLSGIDQWTNKTLTTKTETLYGQMSQ